MFAARVAARSILAKTKVRRHCAFSYRLNHSGQCGSGCGLHGPNVGAVDGAIRRNVLPEVGGAQGLTGLRLRLRDVARVHRAVARGVAEQDAHRNGNRVAAVARGILHRMQRDEDVLRIRYAS